MQGSSNGVESLSLATPEGGLVRYRGTRPLGCLFSLMIRLPGRILPTQDRELQIVLFPSMEGPVGILPAVQRRSWLSTILLGGGQTCNCCGGPTSLSVPVSLKQRVQGHAIACIHETQRVNMIAFFRRRRRALVEHEQRARGCIDGVVGSVVPASLV